MQMDNNSITSKAYYHKWKILKQTIFSANRLSLLNKISPIDMKIFKKEINITDNNVLIIYKDHSEIIKHNYDIVDEFYEIKLIKPKLDSTLNDKDNTLNEYLSEKIDNTGNVQLWPCEEILTLYCLLNKKRFYNKNIIELGAGFSGLCGLTIAKNISNTKVTVTDGNRKSVEYLCKNIKLNELSEKVNAKHLIWDKNNKFEADKFDFVLISDCIFFKNYHEDLVETIFNLLSDSGTCIIVSPTRGDALDLFLEMAERKFKIYKSQDEIKFYSTFINADESSFSPYFVEICKNSN